jgi:hypothetical protein
MTDLYTKLHGTTTDRFKIGLKNQRVTLSGTTTNTATTELLDRDGLKHTVDSTVFFTAYIIGNGTNTAAYEIKGCYLQGTTIISGYVTNTFVDTNSFTEPTITFDSDGEITVTCTGVDTDTIDWTAVIDFVSI